MRTDHRWLWIVVGVLALVVLLGSLVGGGVMGSGLMRGYGYGGMMGPGMMWGYGVPASGNGWGWGLGMALGWLVTLAFWGALIVGAILLVRWLLDHSHARSGQGSDDPLAILRRRYAAGEIDRATYDRMVRDLTGTTPMASDRTYSARPTDGQGEEQPVLSAMGRELHKEPDRPER